MEERLKKLDIMINSDCECIYTVEEIKEDYDNIKKLIEKNNILENENKNLRLESEDINFKYNNLLIDNDNNKLKINSLITELNNLKKDKEEKIKEESEKVKIEKLKIEKSLSVVDGVLMMPNERLELNYEFKKDIEISFLLELKMLEEEVLKTYIPLFTMYDKSKKKYINFGINTNDQFRMDDNGNNYYFMSKSKCTIENEWTRIYGNLTINEKEIYLNLKYNEDDVELIAGEKNFSVIGLLNEKKPLRIMSNIKNMKEWNIVVGKTSTKNNKNGMVSSNNILFRKLIITPNISNEKEINNLSYEKLQHSIYINLSKN